MKKISKFLLGIAFLVCILTGLVYLGLSVYYQNGFSFMTYINGVYCTGKSVEAVNIELNNAFKYEGLMVETKDGSFFIDAEDIGYTFDYTEPVKHYLEQQNPYLWVENLSKGKKEYTLLPAIDFNESILEEIIDRKLDRYISTEKIGVELELTDSGFALKDTKKEIFDISGAKQAINAALLDGVDRIDLCSKEYFYDEVYSDIEQELISFYELLNDFQERKVYYVFDEEVEQFTALDLAKMLSFFSSYTENTFKNEKEISFIEQFVDENGNLMINEENVNAVLEEKLAPYNTYQNHTFTTHDGRILQIKGGTYGNKIAMKTELKELLAFLQSSNTEYIRTPEYTKETPIKGKNDIGDTYIEVDIGQQKMFYYRDGELFIETDVVTGKNNATREEVCYVYAKQKNRILRGDNYESFVYYWMPVSGGIGIHDATWRSKFGGDIYIRDGSHGCINTPLEIVKQMYEVMEVGTPCILYYGLEDIK